MISGQRKYKATIEKANNTNGSYTLNSNLREKNLLNRVSASIWTMQYKNNLN